MSDRRPSRFGQGNGDARSWLERTFRRNVARTASFSRLPGCPNALSRCFQPAWSIRRSGKIRKSTWRRWSSPKAIAWSRSRRAAATCSPISRADPAQDRRGRPQRGACRAQPAETRGGTASAAQADLFRFFGEAGNARISPPTTASSRPISTRTPPLLGGAQLARPPAHRDCSTAISTAPACSAFSSRAGHASPGSTASIRRHPGGARPGGAARASSTSELAPIFDSRLMRWAVAKSRRCSVSASRRRNTMRWSQPATAPWRAC